MLCSLKTGKKCGCGPSHVSFLLAAQLSLAAYLDKAVFHASMTAISRRGIYGRDSRHIGCLTDTLVGIFSKFANKTLHLTFSLLLHQNCFDFRLELNGRDAQNAHRNFQLRPKVLPSKL
jgi:hypothetical protein